MYTAEHVLLSCYSGCFGVKMLMLCACVSASESHIHIVPQYSHAYPFFFFDCSQRRCRFSRVRTGLHAHVCMYVRTKTVSFSPRKFRAASSLRAHRKRRAIERAAAGPVELAPRRQHDSGGTVIFCFVCCVCLISFEIRF